MDMKIIAVENEVLYSSSSDDSLMYFGSSWTSVARDHTAISVEELGNNVYIHFLDKSLEIDYADYELLRLYFTLHPTTEVAVYEQV